MTMREIKFRGRGAYQRSVWYVGDLVRCDDGRITIRKDEANEFYVDPETVGQFTGLKDADGREIYEGDVIQIVTENPYWEFKKNFAVEWGLDGFNLDGDTLYSWFKFHTLKVIGNIYDNPELLERKP